jgi:hypothetical protein
VANTKNAGASQKAKTLTTEIAEIAQAAKGENFLCDLWWCVFYYRGYRLFLIYKCLRTRRVSVAGWIEVTIRRK